MSLKLQYNYPRLGQKADRLTNNIRKFQPHAGNQSSELGLTEAEGYLGRTQPQESWTESDRAATNRQMH